MKKNLVEIAYERVLDMIYKFQLPPGSRVSDFVLSRKLGISRTPIRQAIMMLVADDLIESDEIGYAVPAISEEKIDLVYDARLCMERALLRLAIEKGVSKENLSLLRSKIEIVQNDYSEGRILDSIEDEIEFRRFLCSLCGNSILFKSFKRLEMQSRTFSVFALAFPIFQAPKSYSEICDAIEAGDADKACEILSVFIEITRQQKKKALKDFGPDVLTGIYGFIAKSYELRDRQKMEADHADT